jgi:hypothetical protein
LGPRRIGEEVQTAVSAETRSRRCRQAVSNLVVIHRARADLLRAELDGGSLVQRATGGNATRFALDPAARVTVV